MADNPPKAPKPPKPPKQHIPDRTIRDAARGVVIRLHKNPKTL